MTVGKVFLSKPSRESPMWYSREPISFPFTSCYGVSCNRFNSLGESNLWRVNASASRLEESERWNRWQVIALSADYSRSTSRYIQKDATTNLRQANSAIQKCPLLPNSPSNEWRRWEIPSSSSHSETEESRNRKSCWFCDEMIKWASGKRSLNKQLSFLSDELHASLFQLPRASVRDHPARPDRRLRRN